MSEASFPPIETMLPHRDPFLFIESIYNVLEDRIECRGLIKDGHYLTHEREAPSILGIEMGAQAAGVHAALLHRAVDPTEPPPRIGYLVGIRQARFHAKALPTGRTLRIEAVAQGASGPLATYRILVREEGQKGTLVEARISTWAAEEPKP